MSCPRPILKQHSSSTSSSPHTHRPSNHDRDRIRYAVHFPPSPTLTRTFSVYSASTYDRSPIVVGPNTCALPERGCPGRTYTLEEPSPHTPGSSPKRSMHSGRHIHPRSISNSNGLGLLFGDEGHHLSIGDQHPSDLPPPLVPDLSSSESDESDGLISPPSHHPNIPIPPIQVSLDDTYSRRPRAKDIPKQRKRVRSPNRRPPCAQQDDSDDDGTTSRSSWTDYKSLSEKSLRSCLLPLPDEGCFGGF